LRESERDRANQRQSEREGKRLTERGRGTEKTSAKKIQEPNTTETEKLKIGQGREKRTKRRGEMREAKKEKKKTKLRLRKKKEEKRSSRGNSLQPRLNDDILYYFWKRAQFW